MARILAIDYGKRRCGLAATDPLCIVASPLCTIQASQLEAFVVNYVAQNAVRTIVVGHPRQMNGAPSETMAQITPLVNRLRKILPAVAVELFDERFTSVLAHRAMVASGMSAKKRRDKAQVDMLSATIILNDYLQAKQHNI